MKKLIRQHFDRQPLPVVVAPVNEVPSLIRRGVSVPTTTRYAWTAASDVWLTLERGRPIVDAILEAVDDGKDRAIIAWPSRLNGGFAAAALAMREARATGRLAFATFAFWPWRSGATWAARTIVVNPLDLAQAAVRTEAEMRQGTAWPHPQLAHESATLLEMRLRDLRPVEAGAVDSANHQHANVQVRNPTLLETTCVFDPTDPSVASPYLSNGNQVLRRVRTHTHLGDKNARLETRVEAVGNPQSTPFAIFGLPAATKVPPLTRCLRFPRFGVTGLDAVIVDVTRTGRSDVPDDWEGRLAAMLQALREIKGRRPPVIVLAEDAFAHRKALRVLRAANYALQPRRAPPLELGSYLQEPGLLGQSAELPTDITPTNVEADIKDASLAHLRDALLNLGQGFRLAGHAVGADGVSRALGFLRRCASLPMGLREAREVSDIICGTDDPEDIAIRALFRPKVALGALANAAEAVPELASEARRLIGEIEQRAQAWADETPVSAKLFAILHNDEWDNADTVLIVADRRIADMYSLTDRALRLKCRLVDSRGAAELKLGPAPSRIIVLGPTPDVIRALLTMPLAPERILFLGDAAGVALLAGELTPVSQIAAFAPIAERARAMLVALKRGGGDENLDLTEAEFRVVASLPEGEIDLTRAGKAYKGDVLRITTSRYRLRYRPASDVLRFSPSEVRPFERVTAREIRTGDRILVLNSSVRESIRRAIAGSRESLRQLDFYHQRIASVRATTPGSSDSDKARYVLAAMRERNAAIGDHEFYNVLRWITADMAPRDVDGSRQPRAARDEPRFNLFMSAVGIGREAAKMFWRVAILPTRSYRVQDGFAFNRRVVQFVLDPEGVAAGANALKDMPRLWESVLGSVEDVVEVVKTHSDGV